MPFLGFVQEKDLESFEKDKLGKLSKTMATLVKSSNTRIQNVDNGLNVFQKEIDSISSNVEANSTSIKSLNESSTKECTKIINGIHICNEPLYENVKKPFEVTYKDLVKGSDLCVGVENVLDVFPTKLKELSGFKKFWSSRDSDFPDNFVCIEGEKGKNYVDTFIKKDIVKHISEKGDKYPLISFHKITPKDIISPRCSEICKRYECKELDDNRRNVYNDGISSSQCLGCGESSDFKCNLKTM